MPCGELRKRMHTENMGEYLERTSLVGVIFEVSTEMEWSKEEFVFVARSCYIGVQIPHAHLQDRIGLLV